MIEDYVITLNHDRRGALEGKKAEYERRLEAAIANRAEEFIQDTRYKLAVIGLLLEKPPGEDVTVTFVRATNTLLDILGTVNFELLRHAFASVDAVNSGDWSGVYQQEVPDDTTPKPPHALTEPVLDTPPPLESETRVLQPQGPLVSPSYLTVLPSNIASNRPTETPQKERRWWKKFLPPWLKPKS